MPKLHHKELLDFSEILLATGGMPLEDARLVARLLVRAELRGYPGHGITRVPQYLSFIKHGTIDLGEKPKILREGKTTAVIDGNHYIGQVVANEGMQLAIKKAKEHGAGLVTIRRAGHSGRLADYMEMAADQGTIGTGTVSVGFGTQAL